MAIRAFFPLWVFLYVVQFLLLPAVTGHHWSVFFPHLPFLRNHDIHHHHHHLALAWEMLPELMDRAMLGPPPSSPTRSTPSPSRTPPT